MGSWKIFLGYPWWYVLLCLVLGGIYAALLYFKSKKFEKPYTWLNFSLPVIRFILVSLVAFFLLAPLVRYIAYRNEKPILTFAIDKSASMIQGAQAIDPLVLSKNIDLLKSKLADRFEIETILFDENTTVATSNELIFNGAATNIGNVLEQTQSQNLRRNMGALILISDGIYNDGFDPRNILENLNFPVMSVGTGDTNTTVDAAIKQVLHNPVAYLNNSFVVNVDVKAEKLNGKQALLTIEQGGRIVKQQNIVIKSESDYIEQSFELLATGVGFQTYKVKLSALTGEKNIQNNVAEFSIEVIDGRKKILILSEQIHPDLGALKNAIEANDKYEVKTIFKDFPENPAADIVVMGLAFKSAKTAAYIQKLKTKGIPVFVMLGGDFSAALFNQNPLGLRFSERSGDIAALPSLNTSFELFEMDENLQNEVKNWSPLNVKYGSFSGVKPNQILSFQKIGSVTTQEPLIFVGNEKNYRFGVVAGSGLWRWRLLDFERNATHDNFNSFWNGIIQYLSVKEEKKQLTVSPTKAKYNLGENAVLQGQLLNQNLLPVTDADILVKLQKNDSKQEYSYTMSKNTGGYVLPIAGLEAGKYRYTASTSLGGEFFKDQGSFEIVGIEKELVDLVANHGLLKNISSATGGQFVKYENINQLEDVLLSDTRYKEIQFEETNLKDLIQLKWVFWLLMLLLTFEWFWRKTAAGI